MEWVVTTGRSIDEAKARALDALGIDESDLECEVLQEASTSLFGLRTTEARVRARVRPTRPRPKLDRRQRRKPKGKRQRGRRRGKGKSSGPNAGDRAESKNDGSSPGTDARSGRREQPDASPPPSDRPAVAAPEAARSPADASPAGDDAPEGEAMTDISIDDQEPVALQFLEGLLDAFGAEASVSADRVDDDTLELAVDGEDLGLLVGPRGNTLAALQELTRTAVAQQQSGRLDGRLRVDVAGYLVRRKEALTRFAAQQAAKVQETGERVALEPMSPPDRKIVHDAVNEIEGVRTESRGEDRRRHIVILPD